MKFNFKKILTFLFILLMYFLPALLFKVDKDFYNSLAGPKIPSWIFSVSWSIIYVCISLLITHYLFSVEKKQKKDFVYFMIFIVANYIISFWFQPTFFCWHNLFWSYTITLFSFVTMMLAALNSLLIDKKWTLLTLPYLCWTLFATIISILLYLKN
jgi:benzodiazapine receptor